MLSTLSTARIDSVSVRATKLAAALLTRMSSGRSLKAASIISSTASGLRMSTGCVRTFRPNAAANSCAASASTPSRRPQIMSSAPSAMKRRPIALPSPVPPPVTSTTRSLSRSGANMAPHLSLIAATSLSSRTRITRPRRGRSLMELFDLTGKVAIVTGGNGGIGLGMARGLGAAGATVVIVGRNKEKCETAAAELREGGAKVAGIVADVTREESCRTLVGAAVKAFGRLDILVNNAGINIRKRPEEYTIEEWNTVLVTNLSSAFVCAQAAYPEMVGGGGGKIVNIGSMMSIFGAPFAAPYAATKGAVVQLTKALATAWAKDNIQVNAVLPGWIDTDLTRQARQQIDGLHDRVLARTPAGRRGCAHGCVAHAGHPPLRTAGLPTPA